MSLEVGVVLGARGEVIYWHVPGDRSVAQLPDSRTLWDVIWSERDRVAGFAHTHPGGCSPSWTDLTTFAAVEAGLGRHLDWWILDADDAALYRFVGPGKQDYDQCRTIWNPVEFPSWMTELRRRSGWEDERPIVF